MENNHTMESHPLFRAVRSKDWGNAGGEMMKRDIAIGVFQQAVTTAETLREKLELPATVSEWVVRTALRRAENPNEASRMFQRALGDLACH